MSEFHFQPIKGKAREILKAILQTPEVSSCSLKVGFVLRLASYIGNNVALAVWASSSSSKRWMPSAMLTRTITMY